MILMMFFVKVDHNTVVYVPYSFRTVVWVLLQMFVPQEPDKCKCCETGPTIFRPYPRRLESLTGLQRQHFLLSYLKTLSVGPIAFSPADSKCQAFVKRASTGNRLLMTSLTHAHPRKGRRGTSKTRLDIKTSYSGFQISERSQCMITLP